jgi:hypothetical protein
LRAYEHPLLAFDRVDWACVIPSASEAEGRLEPADVQTGEYRIYTLDGHVAEARVFAEQVTLRVSEQLDLAGFHERLATLVHRYELASSPDDPVAVANELLRRAWETGSAPGSVLRRARRPHRKGPDIVQPPPADEHLIDLLRGRDGRPCVVELHDGRRLKVVNIAWGYDMGDTHAHVTTNCSPAIEGEPMDLFFTHEIQRVLEPDAEQPLRP